MNANYLRVRGKKTILIFSALMLLFSAPCVASADDFIIGGFWAPQPGYTTSTQYDYIRDANLNLIMYDHGFTETEVLQGLDLSAARGIKGTVADTRDNMTSKTDAEIDAIVNSYKNHPATYSYHVYDEPSADLFPKLAHIYKRMADNDPTRVPNVNLFPIIANPTDTLKIVPTAFVSQGAANSGAFVTSSNRLGQTFITDASTTFIDKIQLNIDSSSWSAEESLTLTLWDSPARNTNIGSVTLSASNNGNFPEFSIQKSISPETSYYWELTHDGGGNNSVGWVTYESADVYADGQAYINDSSAAFDFSFTAYKGYTGKDKVVEQTSASWGSYVSSTNSLGQTFKTPPVLERNLEYIELNVDSSQWSTSETLTLTVYNSLSKNQILGRSSMTESNNGNFPRFYVYAHLEPDTTYYFELTHGGGGDNSVGWVTRTTSSVYADGAAYDNGTAMDYDFYFRSMFFSKYQAYMEAWADALGPAYFKTLSYDMYPFLQGIPGVEGRYFLNLEYARGMALKKNAKLRTYLSSFGITDTYRRPSENEMRFNAFTSAAYGAKELIWFTWFTPSASSFENSIIDRNGNKTDLYTPVQTISSQLKQLGPTLMDLTSKAVYHSGVLPAGTSSVPVNFFWQTNSTNDDVLISYFQNASNRKYIMVVNKSLTNTTTYTFNVNPHPSTVTEVSKSTGSEISTNYNSSTGVISASFAPGEGKLFVLPVGY